LGRLEDPVGTVIGERSTTDAKQKEKEDWRFFFVFLIFLAKKKPNFFLFGVVSKVQTLG
jgi:hypothetical protein